MKINIRQELLRHTFSLLQIHQMVLLGYKLRFMLHSTNLILNPMTRLLEEYVMRF